MDQDFRGKLLSMLGLCFVLIMVALDQTVIGTALPTIASDLNGFDLYAWVATAYLLTSVIALPIFGKLGDEHGRKPFVVVAIILFTLASMLCGASFSMLQLVVSRALQGIAGGMLITTSFASVPDLFPEPRERLRWQVLFSTAFGIANAVGPSLGGYLTRYWGWRYVFFVNLPVGLLSLYFTWRHLPKIRHKENPPSPLDWQGAVLVAAFLSSLQLLVEWLPAHKPFFELALLGAIGIISLFMLIRWESRCDNPILPLSMFSHRSLAPLFALSLLMGFCMFAVMYYSPLLFQGGFGLAADEAGLLVTPLAVSITIGSIINGRIVTRMEKPNKMLYIGISLFLASALFLIQVKASTPHGIVASIMTTGGLGLGLMMPNITLFVQACASRMELGVATALLQSTRMIGGMLGTAIVGVLVSNRYSGNVDKSLADPQILVNRDLEAKFELLHRNASLLVAKARLTLVDAVHHSLWLVVLLLALSLLGAMFVPPISLHRREHD